MNRLGVLESIVEGLGWMWGAADDAPSIVIVAEGGGGAVAQVGVIDGGADFVERIPAPGEFNFGGGPLGRNAGDGHQFSSSGEDVEGFILGVGGRE